MPTETELKLAIRPDDQHLISRLGLVRRHAQQRATRKRVLSVYYDTAERTLSQQGMILRLRKHGGRWLQTVKTAHQAVGGLHQRGEYEMPVRGAQLDFAMLADIDGLEMFGEKQFMEQLQPVFETDFWRTAWQLELPDGSRVELALDTGEVRSGARRANISELELELKRGPAHVLYALACELAESVDVRLSDVSKAQLGYGLANPTPPASTRASKVALAKDMTLEQAFAAVLWNSLAQAQANAAVILSQSQAEGVHQMRVGLRRFRSALAVFRKYVPRGATTAIREDIRRLLAPLGPARDWDVFIHDYLNPMPGGHPAQVSLKQARAAADARRQDNFQNLHKVLASREFNRSMLNVATWIAVSGWRQDMNPGASEKLRQPIEAKAGRILARGHRRLLRVGKSLEKASDEQLHKLRIAVKTQRYAVDFFRVLYRGKAAENYRTSLKNLQGALGRLNDEATARRLLGELDGVVDTPTASHLLKNWRKRSRVGRSKLKKLWTPIRKKKPQWK